MLQADDGTVTIGIMDEQTSRMPCERQQDGIREGERKMQTRVERTYVTDDGRTFKRKADACRHDAELYVTKRGYTPEQFDRMFEQVRNRTKAWNLGASDWRDSYKVGADNGVFLLDDIIDTYEGMKNAHLIVFDYENWKVIHNQTIDMLADDDRVEQAVKDAEERFSDESYECRTPTEDELNELLRSTVGRNLSYTTVLVRRLRPMTITQKLERGIALTEDELEDFVFYGNEVYRDEGDLGRWSRHVSSVIADDNGQLWCVEWEEGLTEMQDNGFYDQPYKAHLDKKPVTVIQTTIVRDE